MIPKIAHFIWFGRSFPWLHLLALKSAAERGGFERVVLHHADPLDDSPWWAATAEIPGFEARPLDAQALLASVPDYGLALQQIYAELEQPAAKANVVRAAILEREGGVYLDLDTLTLGPFDDLLMRGDFFCGEEAIAYPAAVKHSRNPARWARALALDGARDLLRRAPQGWRAFSAIDGLYARGVNNAVVGCPAGHPFVRQLLRAMTEVPVARRRVRYALGTTLLQDQVAAWDAPGLIVYPPELFYPFGPEISQHWFRKTRKVDLRRAISERTIVLHWYASVRTRDVVPRVDPTWIRAHANSELFSALVVRAGLVER